MLRIFPLEIRPRCADRAAVQRVLCAAQPVPAGSGGADHRQPRRAWSMTRCSQRVEAAADKATVSCRSRSRSKDGNLLVRTGRRRRADQGRRRDPRRTGRRLHGRAQPGVDRAALAGRLIGAKPMTLGLDLQGGVHFLMEVDQKAALDKRIECLRRGYPRPAARRRSPLQPASRRSGKGIRVELQGRRRQARSARHQPADAPTWPPADRPDRPTQRLIARMPRRRDQDDHRRRHRAEHRHAAQPHQRARRGRADDPAPGQQTASSCSCRACRTRPQAKRHPRRHRDPGIPRRGRQAEAAEAERHRHRAAGGAPVLQRGHRPRRQAASRSCCRAA